MPSTWCISCDYLWPAVLTTPTTPLEPLPTTLAWDLLGLFALAVPGVAIMATAAAAMRPSGDQRLPGCTVPRNHVVLPSLLPACDCIASAPRTKAFLLGC